MDPLLEQIQNQKQVSEFSHNFCESRLSNYMPPEIYNAYTSLIITAFPLILGFPRNTHFYNLACMLTFNGFASFYYHYYLDWNGKQADEMSMILATYFGIEGLLQMYYIGDRNQINKYNGWNTIFMILFLIFNTNSQYDHLFPILFTMYVSIALSLIYNISEIYDYQYKRYLFISFIGTKCWFISEVYCNEYTQYGHVVWHALFPLGFYQLILYYDEKMMRLKKLK